ncbi:hypothetical protein HNQ09_001901 [Deinococcus budaensis]|uniref:Uncharacterized protein n=1 Tax=Deinococcus budaensis TaxID=1665626 RepID=A0A7W8GFD9_9DEIO|nr:hypothetical protein [Deinococcus budaensis]
MHDQNQNPPTPLREPAPDQQDRPTKEVGGKPRQPKRVKREQVTEREVLREA